MERDARKVLGGFSDTVSLKGKEKREGDDKSREKAGKTRRRRKIRR
jgi:hypothetical protein